MGEGLGSIAWRARFSSGPDSVNVIHLSRLPEEEKPCNWFMVLLYEGYQQGVPE